MVRLLWHATRVRAPLCSVETGRHFALV